MCFLAGRPLIPYLRGSAVRPGVRPVARHSARTLRRLLRDSLARDHRQPGHQRDAGRVTVRRAVLALLGRVRLTGLVSVAVLLSANLLPNSQAWAQTAPRVAANALPTGLSQKTGTPIAYTPGVRNASTGITSATITQTDATNIVSWDRFDIGAAARLNIVQPSASSVLLNKVSGGAFQNKIVIDGVLNANGRVYLYNPNGIVFGKTGVVNTSALIASSLKFDEARVIGGLLQPGATPVLAADAAIGQVPGAVTVEGDSRGRATLTVASNGLLLLAAPQVTNNGMLSAPDGQVMLAAGSKVLPNTMPLGL